MKRNLFERRNFPEPGRRRGGRRHIRQIPVLWEQGKERASRRLFKTQRKEGEKKKEVHKLNKKKKEGDSQRRVSRKARTLCFYTKAEEEGEFCLVSQKKRGKVPDLIPIFPDGGGEKKEDGEHSKTKWSAGEIDCFSLCGKERKRRNVELQSRTWGLGRNSVVPRVLNGKRVYEM